MATQRSSGAKRRPSARKLNTGLPVGPGQLQRIRGDPALPALVRQQVHLPGRGEQRDRRDGILEPAALQAPREVASSLGESADEKRQQKKRTPRELRAGDVIVIPRGVPHWFKSVTTPFRYYVVKSISGE